MKHANMALHKPYALLLMHTSTWSPYPLNSRNKTRNELREQKLFEEWDKNIHIKMTQIEGA